MTQQQLAEKVGVRFQQIQKYETGTNRVSASRLWDMANAMEVPVDLFFAGQEEAEAANALVQGDVLTDREALELLRSYYSIPEQQRRRLFELARVLSDTSAQ